MATGEMGTNDGPTEVFDCKVTFRFQNSTMQTGFSMRRNGALAASLQDVANNIDANFAPTLVPLLPGGSLILSSDVVNPITKQGASRAFTGTQPSGGGALGPGFIAVVLSLKGEIRARYGQGRMFLPCVFDAMYDFEYLVGTGHTLLDPVVNSFNTNYVGSTVSDPFTAVNWHRALPAGRPNNTRPDIPAVPARWYDVQSIRLNEQVTSIRSRKQGIGG